MKFTLQLDFRFGSWVVGENTLQFKVEIAFL